MQRFALTLHGPGLPGSGVATAAHFSGDFLVLESGAAQQVPAASIGVSVGGFDDATLFLNWDTAEGRWAAIPQDESARQALVAAAPAALLPQLRRGNFGIGAQRFKWNAVMTTLAVLVGLVVLLWWQSSALTAWVARQVPQGVEERIGKTVLASVKAEGELTQTGPAAEMVKTVGTKLTAGSRYKYQWYVKDDASVNAFAIPGGVVVVHTGLIAKAANAEEVAGVLAHEVQHVELRHSLQNLVHTAGWAAVLAVTLGDVTAITSVLLHQMGNLRFSRGLEAEADALGAQALAKAGIPLGGMASFFEKLAEDRKDALEIALLSSHPAPAERLANIEKLARETPCPGCRPLAIDWAVVQADVAGDGDGDEEAAPGESRKESEPAKTAAPAAG